MLGLPVTIIIIIPIILTKYIFRVLFFTIITQAYMYSLFLKKKKKKKSHLLILLSIFCESFSALSTHRKERGA